MYGKKTRVSSLSSLRYIFVQYDCRIQKMFVKNTTRYIIIMRVTINFFWPGTHLEIILWVRQCICFEHLLACSRKCDGFMVSSIKLQRSVADKSLYFRMASLVPTSSFFRRRLLHWLYSRFDTIIIFLLQFLTTDHCLLFIVCFWIRSFFRFSLDTVRH